MSTKALPLVLALALAACGGSEEAKDNGDTKSTSTGGHPLESRYSPTPPEGAIEVSQLRGRADGEKVVVRADVMDHSPVDGMAVLKVIDHSLLSCDEMGDDDHCSTPWDFCCVDEAEITLATALVEFKDGDLPVAASLEGFHGIDYLSDVVVAGTLHIDDQQNLTVVADSIHVE